MGGKKNRLHFSAPHEGQAFPVKMRKKKKTRKKRRVRSKDLATKKVNTTSSPLLEAAGFLPCPRSSSTPRLQRPQTGNLQQEETKKRFFRHNACCHPSKPKKRVGVRQENVVTMKSVCSQELGGKKEARYHPISPWGSDAEGREKGVGRGKNVRPFQRSER